MCTDCGCVSSPTERHSTLTGKPRTIQVEESLLAKNARLAQVNRGTFLAHQLLVLNMVSSPGSGKTSLLERTLAEQKQNFAFAVVEGDQQTENDARRIAATGVPVKQINTGSGCHLDAHMISHGVQHFNLESTDVLIIENVGNLVCPASFDLGEDYKVVVLSVTEGEDKPLKYPQMFQAASLMLINKVDLLPYLQFDLEKCKSFARRVNPAIEIIELSCQNGLGMDQWYQWLADKLVQKQCKPCLPQP